MKAAYRILAIFALALTTFSQPTAASALNMFKFKGLGANASFSSRFKGTFRASEASGSVSDGTINFIPEPLLGALLVSSKSQDMAIGCS